MNTEQTTDIMIDSNEFTTVDGGKRNRNCLKEHADYVGKGSVLFTGPDGICDHQVTVLEPATYVGIGIMSPESTSELSYLWRPAQSTTFPSTGKVGKTGWMAMQFMDAKILKTYNQIQLKEFRQLAEDRHLNRY